MGGYDASKLARKCIFCGCALGTKNRAREDVIPAWLQRELNIFAEPLALTHYSWLESGPDMPPALSPVSTRQMTVGGFLNGKTCHGCNSRWMSRLEMRVRRPLTALIRGSASPMDFDEQDLLELARWVLKTAYAYNHCANYSYRMPRAHGKWLTERKHNLPPRVMILYGKAKECVPYSVCHSPSWHLIVDNATVDSARSEIRKSYKVGMQFGNAMFAAIWWAGDGWSRYVITNGVHYSLWPRSGPVIFESNQSDPFIESNIEQSSKMPFFRWLQSVGVAVVEVADGSAVSAGAQPEYFKLMSPDDE